MTTIYTSINEIEVGLRQASDALLDTARLMRIIAGSDIQGKELKQAEACLDRLGEYITHNGDALMAAHKKMMVLSDID